MIKHIALKSPYHNLRRENIISHKASAYKIIFYIVIVMVFSTVYVWERVAIDTLSMNTSKLKEKKASLTAYSEILKAEIEAKTKFESIDKIAREKLHLDFPGDNAVVLILEGPAEKSLFKKSIDFIKNTLISIIQ